MKGEVGTLKAITKNIPFVQTWLVDASQMQNLPMFLHLVQMDIQEHSISLAGLTMDTLPVCLGQ